MHYAVRLNNKIQKSVTTFVMGFGYCLLTANLLLSLPLLIALIAHHELSLFRFFCFEVQSRAKECNLVCLEAQSFRQVSKLCRQVSDLFSQNRLKKRFEGHSFALAALVDVLDCPS